MSKTFKAIVDQYAHCDIDGDGVTEIEAGLMSFETAPDPVDPNSELVLVLVNRVLLDSIPNPQYTTQELVYRLARLKYDLQKEGRQARCLALAVRAEQPTDVPCGGKVVLALRQLFRTVRAEFPKLSGAILVGPFPDAKITHLGPEHLTTRDPNGKVTDDWYHEGGFLYAGAPWDIVLADLDGRWDSLYRGQLQLQQHDFHVGPRTVVSQSGTVVTLLNPVVVLSPPQGPTTLYDTFFVQDCRWTMNTLANGDVKVTFDLAPANPEVGPANLTKPNPVSTPSIRISRLNARHAAVQPPDPRLLGADGKPQAASMNPPIDLSYGQWPRDPNLERTLLIEYFDRNHLFRTGATGVPAFETSVAEAGLGTSAINEGLQGIGGARVDVINTNLLAFIRWLKRPTSLRGVAAHGDCYSTFLTGEDDATAAIAEAEAGGKPWRWIEQNGQYVPSFKGHYTGDLMLYRTLWENGKLAHVPPSFMLHIGCSVGSMDCPEKPYTNPRYGTFQNAECILFYANQLAIMAHNAWWNHGPRGFGGGFGASATATFGDGWKAFMDGWALDGSLATQPAEQKRSYEWNLVGDWTLMKSYAPVTALPDLTLASLTPSQTVVRGAALVRFETTIKNLGPVDSGPALVSLSLLDVTLIPRPVAHSLSFEIVGALKPGATAKATFLRGVSAGKSPVTRYRAVAMVDPLHDIPETKETNNTAMVAVTAIRAIPPVPLEIERQRIELTPERPVFVPHEEELVRH